MPLRKERRRFYGPKWRAFRLELIEEEGRACTTCDTEHPMINLAHTDHDPKNKASVRRMCPSCHARHDAGHRIAIMRRRKATETGQTWLLEELEYAPLASWEIPARVYDRMMQMSLFQSQ